MLICEFVECVRPRRIHPDACMLIVLAIMDVIVVFVGAQMVPLWHGGRCTTEWCYEDNTQCVSNYKALVLHCTEHCTKIYEHIISCL